MVGRRMRPGQGGHAPGSSILGIVPDRRVVLSGRSQPARKTMRWRRSTDMMGIGPAGSRAARGRRVAGAIHLEHVSQKGVQRFRDEDLRKIKGLRRAAKILIHATRFGCPLPSKTSCGCHRRCLIAMTAPRFRPGLRTPSDQEENLMQRLTMLLFAGASLAALSPALAQDKAAPGRLTAISPPRRPTLRAASQSSRSPARPRTSSCSSATA